MEIGRRKATSRNSVATGSIWESRMIIDEVKGGIKVFNGDSNSEETDDHTFPNIKFKEKNSLPNNPKRKTWKSESPENRIHMIRSSTSEDNQKLTFGITATDSSMLVDTGATAAVGTKKSPIQRKMRSDGCALSMKVRSEKSTVDMNESGTKTTLSLRKSKSERRKTVDFNMRKPKCCLESEVCEKPVICGSSKDNIDIEIEKDSETCLNLKEVDNIGVTEEEKLNNVEEKEQNCVLFTHNSAENMPMKIMNEFTDSSPPCPETFFPEDDQKFCHHKVLQTSVCQNNWVNLVDLVMWRDSSKSAIVFGVGTFFTLLSSYSNELNISFFTLSCYVGLLYTAAMCLHKTITSRSDADDNNSRSEKYMISEEEAIGIAKLVLPYINFFIVNITCLFSGDLITTSKMAVLFFLSARSGFSISLFQILKIGFFGAFIFPKFYSLYGKRLTNLVRRFQNVWEFLPHKALSGALFVFIWNISSAMIRTYIVLLVALVAVGCRRGRAVVTGGRNDENEEKEEEC